MQRGIAILASLALIFASGHVSTLHIHAYTDHDHPEHLHGPAVHAHGHGHGAAAGQPLPHKGPRFEGCDPGLHTVSVTLASTSPQQGRGDEAECVTPGVTAPGVRVPATTEITDLRVHGPPDLTHAAPRAPPASISL